MLVSSLFLSFLLLEIIFPIRKNRVFFSARKFGNIALYPLISITSIFSKGVCVWFIMTYIPLSGVSMFSFSSVYPLAYICFSFLILDLSMYVQHRLFHRSSLLWGIHALHHTDTEIDVTTYFRHHPLEIFISIVLVYLTVIIFGINQEVLIFYFFVNTIFQLIQHSNIAIPSKVNRWLVYAIVTPTFHSQHHSVIRKEADTNYSTIFSIWDRIFGTYYKKDSSPATFGVNGFESIRYQGIDLMLFMPLLVWFKKGNKE